MNKDSTQYLFAMRLDRSFYTATLRHRTQILYSMDIAFVIANLNVKPGDTVIETGTGSGSLSFSFMRALGGQGHLYSFEYNTERAEAAQKEFNEMKASNVTYHPNDAEYRTEMLTRRAS